MCNAPVVSTMVRGATDVMTFGTAEVGGMSKKLGAAAASLVPPKPATPAPPATVADPGPVQTTSTKETPGSNAEAEMAQKTRRAAALRAGIMSTIGPNLGSIGNTTPKMAFATGMKTALGQ